MFDTRNDLPANDLGPDLFTGISRDNDTHLHAKR
jgi:hypothetical protein